MRRERAQMARLGGVRRHVRRQTRPAEQRRQMQLEAERADLNGVVVVHFLVLDRLAVDERADAPAVMADTPAAAGTAHEQAVDGRHLGPVQVQVAVRCPAQDDDFTVERTIFPRRRAVGDNEGRLVLIEQIFSFSAHGLIPRGSVADIRGPLKRGIASDGPLQS